MTAAVSQSSTRSGVLLNWASTAAVPIADAVDQHRLAPHAERCEGSICTSHLEQRDRAGAERQRQHRVELRLLDAHERANRATCCGPTCCMTCAVIVLRDRARPVRIIIGWPLEPPTSPGVQS